MKRRNFFRLAATGAAALTLGTSCKPSNHDAIKTESGTGIPQEPPDYRKSIKPFFTNNKGKNAGDKVILALIGAGSWGTNLILEAAKSGENIKIKYVCGVDDTRGGHAISEIEKLQGFRPIAVRDMRKVYDDKEVDGVFIETPEHWHALAAIWACQAEKDVYVEKTISHSISEGQQMIKARDVPDYQMTTFDYGKFALTLETGECTPYMQKEGADVRFGEIYPKWMQNSTRIDILGTKRMMYVGRMGGGWQVFDKDEKIVAQGKGISPLKAHILNYIDCIRTRKQPNGNIVEGHHSAVMIHLANLSYRVGNKQLLFSPEYETILNDSKASTLNKLTYRKGFEITSTV